MSEILSEYPVIRTLSLGTRSHLSLAMAGWWTPASRRGDNRAIPGLAGQAPRPVVSDSIRFLHPVRVDGRFTTAGAATGDPWEGWRVNLGLLETACAPAGSSPWTFEAVHHLRDGATRTAQIQVVDIVVPSRPAGVSAEVTLDIVVPSGLFVYAPGSS